MLVKELSKLSGIPAHVVRYYARIGLLAPSRNPANGYQQFSNFDLIRIYYIQAGQRAGIDLAELNLLLEREDHGTPQCCVHMKDTLKQRLTDKRLELDILRQQIQRMERLLSEWQEPLGCSRLDLVICPQIQREID